MYQNQQFVTSFIVSADEYESPVTLYKSKMSSCLDALFDTTEALYYKMGTQQQQNCPLCKTKYTSTIIQKGIR